MLMPCLPDEIVIDILSRLSVRSLLQFRCVSKSWLSLISSPDFAQSHLRKSLLSPTLCKSRERVLLNDFPLHSINYNSPEPITDLHHPLLNSRTWVQILGSCNGFVCLLIGFSESIILYNPATRKYRSIEVPSSPSPLPDDEGQSWGCWGFGFDPNLQEYKVVRQVWGPPPCGEFRVQVLRLVGSDQAIVSRQVCCGRVVDEPQAGVFLNGSIHWQTDFYSGKGDVIVCFDLAREVFDEMRAPVHLKQYVVHGGLGVLDGYLYVLDCLEDHYNVWVMKEYGISTSWTVLFVLPCCIRTGYLAYLRPVTFKSDREILLDVEDEQEWKIVIFDLQEGTFETILAISDADSCENTVYVESLVSP